MTEKWHQEEIMKKPISPPCFLFDHWLISDWDPCYCHVPAFFPLVTGFCFLKGLHIVLRTISEIIDRTRPPFSPSHWVVGVMVYLNQ